MTGLSAPQKGDTGIRPIRGVLFDMDGLLLDSETLSLEAFVKAAQDLDYKISFDFARQMIGLPGDACARLVIETYGEGIALDRLFHCQTVRLRELVDSGRLVVKAGVIPLLDYLDSRGLPRGIATSSGRTRTDDHLKHVGIFDRFDAIVTRDDVRCGKPDPEPYLRAAQAIGVAPADCLVLEDSHNGVRAAHAAGMRVIVVPDLMGPDEEISEKAHAIMENLHQVKSFMKQAEP